jgi:hypothetical protein
VFVPGKHFQLSLIFYSKARAFMINFLTIIMKQVASYKSSFFIGDTKAKQTTTIHSLYCYRKYLQK